MLTNCLAACTHLSSTVSQLFEPQLQKNPSEFVAKSTTSCMKACCNELVHQSEEIRMNVNARKTKEMLIGPMAKDPPPLLLLCGATVVRVKDLVNPRWLSL